MDKVQTIYMQNKHISRVIPRYMEHYPKLWSTTQISGVLPRYLRYYPDIWSTTAISEVESESESVYFGKYSYGL